MGWRYDQPNLPHTDDPHEKYDRAQKKAALTRNIATMDRQIERQIAMMGDVTTAKLNNGKTIRIEQLHLKGT